jgi:hypothetical protein
MIKDYTPQEDFAAKEIQRKAAQIKTELTNNLNISNQGENKSSSLIRPLP